MLVRTQQLVSGLLLLALAAAPLPAHCELYHMTLLWVLPRSTRSGWRDSWQWVAMIQTTRSGTVINHEPWTRSFGDRAHSDTLRPDHRLNAKYTFELGDPNDTVVIKWALVNGGDNMLGQLGRAVGELPLIGNPLTRVFTNVAFGNCDGPLAAGTIVKTKAQLDAGRVLIEQTHMGIDSAWGCGENSRYETAILLDSEHRCSQA